MDDERTTEEPANEPVDTAVAADGLAEASTATTIGMAEAQHPGLDTSAPAASEETPSGADTMVLAQTPEEVEAQYVNRAGGPEPTQEGDANADDEENAEATGISADEAADMTDEAPEAAPAAGEPIDADAPDAGEPALDVSDTDTADGGDVTR